MTEWKLTKTKLQSGVWQGIVQGAEFKPQIAVTYLGRPVDDIALMETKEDRTWVLHVTIPTDAIADGVQTVLISDAANDTVVERITLMAGEVLGDDLRAEVDLLRAELDMLKRTFRRHCRETA